MVIEYWLQLLHIRIWMQSCDYLFPVTTQGSCLAARPSLLIRPDMHEVCHSKADLRPDRPCMDRLGKAAPWDTESALWEQIEEQLQLQGGHQPSSGKHKQAISHMHTPDRALNWGTVL